MMQNASVGLPIRRTAAPMAIERRDDRYRDPVRPSIGGLAAIVMASLLAAAVLAAAFSTWRATRDARAATAEILAQLEAIADEVHADLAALRLPDDPVCDDRMRTTLLHAATASHLVAGFALAGSSAAARCEPAGGSVQGSLVFSHQAGDARILARVSSRLLDDRIDPLARMSGVEYAVLDASGTVLRDRAEGRDDLAWRARSARHPLEVRVRLHDGAIPARMRTAAPVWIVFAGLLAGSGVALLRGRLRQRGSTESRLRKAIRKRRFEPVAQPIVDAATGACVGAEVLLRWDHPVRGLVSPEEFIALAEANGMIAPISELMMRKARDQFAAIARAYPHLYFSFNVAPAQLHDPEFAGRLAAIFDHESIPPARVLLELTERESIDEATMLAMTRLRVHGFRLAIDDFGTGHSSLGVIEQMHVDRIKIDRMFLRAIERPDATAPVLETIIGLAARLGIPLVVEGVETAVHHEWLRARGVQSLQGYFFGRPMTADRLAHWLAARATDGEATPPAAVPAADASRLGSLDPDEVADALGGPQGVAIRDRTFRLTLHRQCFLGNEAVDWLVARHGVPRALAVRLGERLVASGRVRHVLDEQDFADAPYFYRVIERGAGAAAVGTAGPQQVDLRALAGAMRAADGIPVGAHAHRGVRYARCFQGRDAVTWLAHRLGTDRAQALAVGRQLVRAGFVRHVLDEHDLRDERYFYHFV